MRFAGNDLSLVPLAYDPRKVDAEPNASGEEERMNHDRNDKLRSDEHGNDEPRERSARGADEASRHCEQAERKPSPIERRDWRGEGVCGDRHTD